MNHLMEEMITDQLSNKQLEDVRDWIIEQINKKTIELDHRDVDSHIYYGRMTDFINAIISDAIIGRYDYPRKEERMLKLPRLMTSIIDKSKNHNL